MRLGATVLQDDVIAYSAVTDAADTMASTGALATVASAGLTQDADTLASAGAVAIAAAGAQVQAADTLAATGNTVTPVTADAALVQGADTLASAGAVAVAAAGAQVQAADTLAGTSALGIGAAAALVQAGDTLASATAEAEGAAAALVQAADTLAAAAVLRVGADALLLQGPDGTAGTASALSIKAVLSVTNASDALAADVSTGAPRNAAATLVDTADTLAAAGTVQQPAAPTKPPGKRTQGGQIIAPRAAWRSPPSASYVLDLPPREPEPILRASDFALQEDDDTMTFEAVRVRSKRKELLLLLAA